MYSRTTYEFLNSLQRMLIEHLFILNDRELNIIVAFKKII